MFIRRTQTRSGDSGQPYNTFRLVQTTRVGSKVKQSTLLNLGSHFNLPQSEWPALAQRIDELLGGQQSLLDDTLSDAGQAMARWRSVMPSAHRFAALGSQHHRR